MTLAFMKLNQFLKINNFILSENVRLNSSYVDVNDSATKFNTFKSINHVQPIKKPIEVSNLDEKVEKIESEKNKIRKNVFGIQMISENLYKQIFKNSINKKQNSIKIQQCVNELKKYDLLTEQKEVPNVDLTLPKLYGNSIEEHFFIIAKQQVEVYQKLLESLLIQIPEPPKEWLLEEGWLKYEKDSVIKVDYPDENALILDIEVCKSVGELPTLATAVSPTAWYSWVSQDLKNDQSTSKLFSTEYLIPLETSIKTTYSKAFSKINDPKIVVGHNVSYDRARIKEQYWLKRTGLRFLDTLSLHVCISGVTSHQKALLKAGLNEEDWSKLSSLNNLSKVHELYCGSLISKEDRDIFINGSINDVKENFQSLMMYCANDVIATHNIFLKMFPLFNERFEHPITLAGMLELQSAFIPVNENWDRYINETNETFEDLNLEAKYLLTQLANEACKLFEDKKYKEDFWLWDEDWNVKHLKLNKTKSKKNSVQPTNILMSHKTSDTVDDVDIVDESYNNLSKKFSILLETEDFLPSRIAPLPGYPIWYRNLCEKPTIENWLPGPVLISTRMQIAPKLLRLTWNSLPLHYVRGSGWGFIVPEKTNIPIEDEYFPKDIFLEYCKNLNNFCDCVNENKCKKNKNNSTGKYVFCKAQFGSSFGLIKLPHKDGPHLNVGNPLARDFINKISEFDLKGTHTEAKRIIEISKMLSYWRNNKERIENQLVCKLTKKDLPKEMHDYNKLGVILPQLIVCGTLTRRAVEPTWMTASNALPDRIGSEMRGIVECPPGYCFVGADVDSQELWIASLLGDAYCLGLHACTPLGWMTLNGQKSEGTDMHSVTAKAVGISRGHAKVLNYARIYGAGQKFSERLLKQFNPDITQAESSQKATKMFEMTKGMKLFRLKDDLMPEIEKRLYSKLEAREICFMYQRSVDELFQVSEWVGGTESSMFNCLERIANEPSPQTPFLKSRLSRALEPINDSNDKHTPTRINWVVQSGAVDFLHLMVVCMRWLVGNEPRFCLSFHDEIRYMVKEDDRYNVALALHITNLLTRSFCVSRVGMVDLPASVAFFSSVEIDKVLRKDANDENISPSNPHGLLKGYGIPTGEALNMYQAIEKGCGQIGIHKI